MYHDAGIPAYRFNEDKQQWEFWDNIFNYWELDYTGWRDWYKDRYAKYAEVSYEDSWAEPTKE